MAVPAGQNLSLFFYSRADSDIPPKEAGIMIMNEYVKILKQISYLKNVQQISYNDVLKFYKSKEADSRCIRRRQEMDYVLANNLPHICFRFDVEIKVKLLFNQKFISHQIQTCIVDPEKGHVRIADLYSQLKRFDCFTHINAITENEKKKLLVELNMELDITKIVFLPKFLDTPLINKILEKLNILQMQRDIVLDVMNNQIKNHIAYFSRMGLVGSVDANKLELQSRPIKGIAFEGKSWSPEYLFKPYWPF